MALGDVFAVKLHLTFAGQECRPGFYLVEGGGAGDPANPAQACAENVAANLGGGIAGFSSALAFTAVEAQDIQPGTNRTGIAPISPAEVGGVADDNPVAPQDSMLIEWTTALKGGKGKFARRGRTYMPGIYGTGQVAGFLIADLQDALSGFASLIFGPYVESAVAYQMHAVAFVPGSNPRVIQEINPIAAFAVDNVVAIQRPRRPGKGI